MLLKAQPEQLFLYAVVEKESIVALVNLYLHEELKFARLFQQTSCQVILELTKLFQASLI